MQNNKVGGFPVSVLTHHQVRMAKKTLAILVNDVWMRNLDDQISTPTE